MGFDFKIDFKESSLIMNDIELEKLWTQGSNIPIGEDECIEEAWAGFEIGTHREVVWHWFDENHSKGVAYLLNGGQ